MPQQQQQQQQQYNIHSPMTPSTSFQHQQYGNIQSPGGVNLQQQNYQQQTSIHSPMPQQQQHLNSPAMPNSVSMIHSPVFSLINSFISIYFNNLFQ